MINLQVSSIFSEVRIKNHGVHACLGASVCLCTLKTILNDVSKKEFLIQNPKNDVGIPTLLII